MNKIKQHFKNHKITYIACGVTAVVVAGVTYYVTRDGAALVNNTNRMAGLINWKNTQKIEVFLEALGDPGNIIQDTTTGTIYASQGQAAKALGIHPSRITEMLKGARDHVNGHKFEKLGKAMVVDSTVAA